MVRFKRGDIAYILESDRFIREGKIENCSGGLFLFKFTEGGAIQVKEHRLYPTEEAVQAVLDSHREAKNRLLRYGIS